MKKLILPIVFSLFICNGFSQKVNEEDSITIKKIFDTALLDGASYDWLDYLSNKVGSRLSGSLGAEKAVLYTEEQQPLEH